MFVLKIATTVWLALIALGMTSATLNEKETVSTRLITDVYLADETGLTGLDRMVNEHFRRTHRRETNYSITHFAKSDYLLQLAQGIIEY